MLDVGWNFAYCCMPHAIAPCGRMGACSMFRQFIEAATALNNLTSRMYARPSCRLLLARLSI